MDSVDRADRCEQGDHQWLRLTTGTGRACQNKIEVEGCNGIITCVRKSVAFPDFTLRISQTPFRPKLFFRARLIKHPPHDTKLSTKFLCPKIMFLARFVDSMLSRDGSPATGVPSNFPVTCLQRDFIIFFATRHNLKFRCL